MLVTADRQDRAAPTASRPERTAARLLGVSVGTNGARVRTDHQPHQRGRSARRSRSNIEDTGDNSESNVKVGITVTAGGKQFKASHVVNSIQPGNKVNVEIPVTGIPLGVAAKVEANVEPVPGETNAENNKATYLAIFSQ